MYHTSAKRLQLTPNEHLKSALHCSRRVPGYFGGDQGWNTLHRLRAITKFHKYVENYQRMMFHRDLEAR